LSQERADPGEKDEVVDGVEDSEIQNENVESV